MDRIIYTTMTGANAAAQRQAVLSNNLANASTTGFRSEMTTFRSVPVQGQGSTTRVFALDATSGHLETPGPAMSDGGTPIDIPQNAKLNFGADGTVVATLPNQPPMSIGRLKMVTPTADQAIKRSDDGLFRGVNGDLPNDGNARLVAGTLEGSNVNAVEQMVGMIAASRQFEQQIKMLQTAESNDKTASQLLSMNG